MKEYLEKMFEELTNQIKARRSYFKLKIKDVAKEIGMPKSTYGHKEINPEKLKLVELIEICTVLKLSLKIEKGKITVFPEERDE